MRILVQSHNLGIFFESSLLATVIYDHYRAMLNETLSTKIEEQDMGNIYFNRMALHATQANVLHLVFEDLIIRRIADIVWPPWSCNLTPLEYNLLGCFQR